MPLFKLICIKDHRAVSTLCFHHCCKSFLTPHHLRLLPAQVICILPAFLFLQGKACSMQDVHRLLSDPPDHFLFNVSTASITSQNYFPILCPKWNVHICDQCHSLFFRHSLRSLPFSFCKCDRIIYTLHKCTTSSFLHQEGYSHFLLQVSYS